MTILCWNRWLSFLIPFNLFISNKIPHAAYLLECLVICTTLCIMPSYTFRPPNSSGTALHWHKSASTKSKNSKWRWNSSLLMALACFVYRRIALIFCNSTNHHDCTNLCFLFQKRVISRWMKLENHNDSKEFFSMHSIIVVGRRTIWYSVQRLDYKTDSFCLFDFGRHQSILRLKLDSSLYFSCQYHRILWTYFHPRSIDSKNFICKKYENLFSQWVVNLVMPLL